MLKVFDFFLQPMDVDVGRGQPTAGIAIKQDRCLLGTWCIPELNKAVEKGYTLLRVYEVYHWPERMQYDADTKRGGGGGGCSHLM